MKLPGFTAAATLREVVTQYNPLRMSASPPTDQVVPQFCYRNGITLCCTDAALGVACKVYWSVQAPPPMA